MAPRGVQLAALVGLVVVVVSPASMRPSASASPEAPASQVPPWASTGFIAYKCGNALCLIRPDRSSNRKLLRAAHPWPQWDPAFSPDGRLVAFRGYYGPAEGAYALYVAGADGCAVHRLTRSIAGNPSWSPDGKWIVFDTSGEGVIWKVHPNGSGLTRIVGRKGADYDGSPAWSPNGQTIAFVRYHRGHGQLWLVRADGRSAKLLHTDAQGSDELPAWSHDGTSIAFASQVGRRTSIEVIDANGSNLRALTNGRSNTRNPVWLPHDAGIAYLVPASSTGSLLVMRPNGTDVHRIVLPRTGQFTWVDAALPQRC
jgi:Tol biopolymer transport system component